jgi:hypothetical protein
MPCRSSAWRHLLQGAWSGPLRLPAAMPSTPGTAVPTYGRAASTPTPHLVVELRVRHQIHLQTRTAGPTTRRPAGPTARRPILAGFSLSAPVCRHVTRPSASEKSRIKPIKSVEAPTSRCATPVSGLNLSSRTTRMLSPSAGSCRRERVTPTAASRPGRRPSPRQDTQAADL